MSRPLMLYLVVALQLALGLYIAIDAYPMFQDSEITPVNYVVRSAVPLVLAAAFIFLARQSRAKDACDDA